MRFWITLSAVGFFSAGCAHVALERHTINQAGTLTDLQNQQVLDNLAMFACNKDAMAWHVKVKGGTIQVTDQVSAGFSADLASAMTDSVKNLFMPSVSGQRSILQQWDVDPTIEADELELLQVAYQKALDPTNHEMEHEILEKICELSLKYDILPSEEAIDKILSHRLREIKKQLDEIKEQLKKPGLSCEQKERLTKQQARLGNQAETINDARKELTVSYNAVRQYLRVQSPQSLPAPNVAPFLLSPSLVPKNDVETALSALSLSALSDWDKERKLAQTERQKSQIGQDAANKILTGLQVACGSGYLPPKSKHESHYRNPGLIDQAGDKIEKLEALIDKEKHPEFQGPWLCVGKKSDVPKCACLVGHYCQCGCDCYVWVMPGQFKTFRDFTLTILALAPPDKQDIGIFRGAAVGPPSR